jgi:hypothetical protein
LSEAKTGKAVRQEPPFGWGEIQDVLDGLVKPFSRRGMEMERDPLPPPSHCESCLTSIRWIAWRNSDECWPDLCGCGGWVEICEDCHTWGRFIETVMS